jgi:hypothetical protein
MTTIPTPYYGGGQVPNPANVKRTVGAPPSTLTEDNLGTLAVDNAAGTIYGLASKSGGVDTWAVLGGGSGAVATLTGDTGTAAPSGGNIKLAGTANQITSTASGATITFSLPAAITAPGSLTATTSLSATTTVTAGTGITATTGNISATAGAVNAGTSITATAGNITATAGNFVSSQAGNGIVLNSGTVAGASSGTLNGRSGQITVTTPTINAGSTFTFTLSNSSVTASTTQILFGLTGGDTGSAITIQSVTNSASQSVIVVQNASAVTNSTGSLVLTFLVLN